MELARNMVIVSDDSEKKYTLVSQLGCGMQGQVWLALSDSDETVALKLMEGPLTEDARREIAMTRTAVERVGRNVPRFYEASSATVVHPRRSERMPKLTLIAMEYIDGVSAGKFAEKRGIPEEAATVIIKDICNVLAKLHQAGIIHADVKSDNIIVSRTGQTYLCDFGVSLIKNNACRNTARGSPMYMAPEVCYDPDWKESYWGDAPMAVFDEKADLWSLGVTAMDLVLGREETRYLIGIDNYAGQNVHIKVILKHIAANPAPIIPGHYNVSKEFRQFLEACLVRHPKARTSAADLLPCRFLSVDAVKERTFQEWLEGVMSKRSQ